MANPTTNFGWVMPTTTSLVTNLPADFNTFGQGVDTSMAGLLGGTTGQILSKTSATNMAFTWINNDQGDITAVTTTAPLQGGGTSGAIALTVDAASTSVSGVVQLSDSTSTTSSVLAATPTAVKSAYDLANGAIAKTTVTTAGDIIYRNATVPTRLGIGTAGQVLTVNSGATAPQWATPAAGSTFSGCQVYLTSDSSLANATQTTINWGSESFDTDAYHSTSTNTDRITIPTGKSGKFLVYGQWTIAAGTGFRGTDVRLNGSSYLHIGQVVNCSGTAGDEPNMLFSFVADLVATDYLTMRIYQNSGSSKTYFSQAYYTRFGVVYLGA